MKCVGLFPPGESDPSARALSGLARAVAEQGVPDRLRDLMGLLSREADGDVQLRFYLPGDDLDATPAAELYGLDAAGDDLYADFLVLAVDEEDPESEKKAREYWDEQFDKRMNEQ